MNRDELVENSELLKKIISYEGKIDGLSIYVTKDRPRVRNAIGLYRKNGKWYRYFNDDDGALFTLEEYETKNKALLGFIEALETKTYIPYKSKEKYYENAIQSLTEGFKGNIGEWHMNSLNNVMEKDTPCHAGITHAKDGYIFYKNYRKGKSQKLFYKERSEALRSYYEFIMFEKEVEEVSKRVAPNYKRSLLYTIFIGR